MTEESRDAPQGAEDHDGALLMSVIHDGALRALIVHDGWRHHALRGAASEGDFVPGPEEPVKAACRGNT